MQKYTLRKADEVGPTKNPVYKLCIDGVCMVDEDEKSIKQEATYEKEISGLYGILRQACNLLALSEKKFHPLALAGIKGKVHEAKTRNLRLYALQLAGKKAVILISKKTNQKKDLKAIATLIKSIELQGELPIEENPTDELNN